MTLNDKEIQDLKLKQSVISGRCTGGYGPTYGAMKLS